MRLTLRFSLAALALGAGCTTGAEPGTVRGACYGNGTCNPALLFQLCRAEGAHVRVDIGDTSDSHEVRIARVLDVPSPP